VEEESERRRQYIRQGSRVIYRIGETHPSPSLPLNKQINLAIYVARSLSISAQYACIHTGRAALTVGGISLSPVGPDGRVRKESLPPSAQI